MNADLTQIETLLDLQGQTVLAHQQGQTHVLTFIHVVAPEGRSLRLVNRQDKSRKPDWLVKQSLFSAIKPAPPNKVGAKWCVYVK